jgi:hypothetical protein
MSDLAAIGAILYRRRQAAIHDFTPFCPIFDVLFQ